MTVMPTDPGLALRITANADQAIEALHAAAMEMLEAETGVAASVWSAAHDTAGDHDLFELTVEVWRETHVEPTTIAAVLAAAQARNPLPTLASITARPEWTQREAAARAAIDAAKARVGEYARLRRQALGDGLQMTGSYAALGEQLGISRQAVRQAMADPKEA